MGLNGSGKSTFLQLIAGIVESSGGDVKVNGRIAAIFELGSGFNLDFTGRENVALYASIAGAQNNLTAEIESEILSFLRISEILLINRYRPIPLE